MHPHVWPIVRRLVARRLPAANVAPVLGDLLEDYEQVAASTGRLTAEWWLVREAVSLVVAYGRPTARTRQAGAFDRWRTDVRQGWRSIRARPGATAATVAVLALGLGVVSTMFALADPYLLRPLPYARAQELYGVSVSMRSVPEVPTLADWQARTDLFRSLAGASELRTVTLAGDRHGSTLTLRGISRNYFEVLGVPAVLTPDWRSPRWLAETPVLLTAAAHRRLFGTARATHALLAVGDASLRPLRVLGVLPDSFLDPSARSMATGADGFTPLADDRLAIVEREPGGGTHTSYLQLLARLAPAVAPEMAEAALTTAPREPRRGTPRHGITVSVESVAASLTARVRPLATAALLAGVLILLVCAANVANLLLARGASRTAEFAVREALGASGTGIARLVLIELGFVTLLGIGAGLAFTSAALAAVAAMIPAEYVSLGAPAITTRVVLFACAAGGVILLAGLVPAWAAWRVTPIALFTRTSTHDSRLARTMRFAMTAMQTAVAVLLLVGAVLLGRSFVNLLAQDPGYDGNVLALRVFYSSSSAQETIDSIAATLDRLGRLPRVSRAAVTTGVLVDGMSLAGTAVPLTINGRRASGSIRHVSTGFFEAAGARLVAGRLPSANEFDRSAVVTESFGRRCCEGTGTVGLVATQGERSYEIVGVIKDIYTSALDQPPGPMAFLPIGNPVMPFVNYVVRVDRPDATLALALEREVQALSPAARVDRGATMRERLMQSVNDRTFATLLVVLFAVAALGVSAAGLAGVVSFTVARRTREIAIRMAVGATSRHVHRLVTGEATIGAAAGAVLGLTTGAWLARLLENLLYGIRPADPVSFLLAAVVIVAVVLAAAWLPARRAMGLAPTIALRSE
jgi:predicted permease